MNIDQDALKNFQASKFDFVDAKVMMLILTI